MTDITLPPPAGLMDCGQGFVEVWTAGQIAAAVLANRDCRTCRHYHAGDCRSVLKCVDGAAYQRAGR